MITLPSGILWGRGRGHQYSRRHTSRGESQILLWGSGGTQNTRGKDLILYFIPSAQVLARQEKNECQVSLKLFGWI